MDEANNGQTMPDAPPYNPLFLAGTPSAAGTPRPSGASNAPDTSPLRGLTARRALGMSTPRTPQRIPLFARELTRFVL